MTGNAAYILAKGYTDAALIGIGAIKGAPCEVQSVVKTGTTTTVTLKWTDTTGVDHTTSFNIEDGVSVTGGTINSVGNLILTLSDGNTIDCGKVTTQYAVLPPASAGNVGVLLQYVGATTSSYTYGYFYESVNDNGTYKWVQRDVQPNTGANNIVEGYYNALDHLFYEEITYVTPISGSQNTLYISLDKNLLYRYTGSAFARVDEGGSGGSSQVSVLPTPGISEAGNIYQYIGATDGTYTNGYFYKCVLKSGVYDWERIDVQPPSEDPIQVTGFPPASATNMGDIYQYIGTSTADYTNGCFYKCTYDTQTGTYSWTPILVQAPETYEDDPIDFNNF